MLDNVISIFESKEKMMKKLKKSCYEERMQSFLKEKGHYIEEMIEYSNNALDSIAAAEEIAEALRMAVEKEYSKHGRINGRTLADINFFMIYYLFPGILLTENPSADGICMAICKNWSKNFKNSNISYADYDAIYAGFRTKLFGFNFKRQKP